MRTITKLCLLGLLLWVAGCVPSLHQLYTEDDLIFEPALVGVWPEREPKGDGDVLTGSWAFTKEGEKSYQLIYTDKEGRTGEFTAHLLKVEGVMFLDLYPAEPGLTQNDFYKLHLLPAHTFLYVSQIEPTLRMACLNPDWLKKLLEREPGAIAHEKMDNTIVLTASPGELQKFLLAHLQTQDAFGKMTELKRSPTLPASPDPEKAP